MTDQPIPPKPADRFRETYRRLNNDEQMAITAIAITAIKEHAASLEKQIEELIPDGREKSLALWHLKDAVTRTVREITE